MDKNHTTEQDLDPPPRQVPSHKRAMAKVQELEGIAQEDHELLANRKHKHRYVFKEGIQSRRDMSVCNICSSVEEWGEVPKGYTEEKLQLRGHWLEEVNRIGGTTGPRWLQLPEYTEGEYD
jgi:hypothetical protein